MEWALPPAVQRRLIRFKKRLAQIPEFAADSEVFVRGGFWRTFLSKYPESNNIHKKMVRVSQRLDRLRRKRSPRLAEAEQLLHEGQCNCAYWHGVFGGLYLNHLRTALYERLIAAERVLDGIEHKDDKWVECETFDFDADGHDEVILENSRLALAFSPTDGGTLFEWDFKDKPFNFGNTLTRREEFYHDLLRQGQVQVGQAGKGDQSIHELVRAKEEGLDAYLVYDPYRRVSLRDHFLHEDVTPQQLWTGTHKQLGTFATSAYSCRTSKGVVTMAHQGMVYVGDDVVPFVVRKTISLQPRASAFEIRYDLVHQGAAPVRVLFGVEFAVNLLTGSSFDRYYRSDDRDLRYAKLGEMGTDEALRHLALRDDWQKLECGFRFDAPARVHRFAIETVSQSESGQERVYQASVVVPCWPIEAEPGQKTTRTIVAEIVMV